MKMKAMKFWYAGCFALSLAFAASGVAFADGSGSSESHGGGSESHGEGSESHGEGSDNNNAACASSMLVCKSLTALGVEGEQAVAHSCTTMSGQAGAWVCPSDENLAKNTSDQRSPVAEAQNYREIDAQ